jgi:hypothetical protein
MALGRILKDRRLKFGTLPQYMLERSPLSPLARLLWGVLDACGADEVAPDMRELAVMLGLKPSSVKTVTRALAELIDEGFLDDIESGRLTGQANNYRLTMPDYCWVEGDELLRIAIKGPRRARVATWEGGRGKTAKRRNRPAWDRMAFWASRPDRQREERRKRAGSASPTPSFEGGAGQPYPLGSASPTGSGQPALPAGPASPTPPAALIMNARASQDDKNQEGQGHPPLASHPSPKDRQEPGRLDLVATWAGWESWSDKFKAVHGRAFRWTPDAQITAAEIRELVGVELLGRVQDEYLKNDYWRGKRHPLKGLKSQLNDFIPEDVVGPLAGAPRCKHPDTARIATERRDQVDQLPGVRHLVTCTLCRVEIQNIFVPDLPEHLKGIARRLAESNGISPETIGLNK